MASEEALDGFLAAFEAGTWPFSGWTHATHVIMAACYLQAFPEAEATARIRRGIRRYNESQGNTNTADSGYHETLTIFWIRQIRAALDLLPAGHSRLEAVRRVAQQFGAARDLFRDYYSFDVVGSREARTAWTPPDRKPLPECQGSG